MSENELHQKPLYRFATIEDKLWICNPETITDDPYEDGEIECTEIYATIHIKITRDVIDRVAEATNHRVYYSAGSGRFRGAEPLASRINAAIIRIAELYATRELRQLYYYEGRRVDQITVVIDFDHVLEDTVRYETEMYEESMRSSRYSTRGYCR